MHYSGQKQVKSIKTKTTQQSAENTSLHIQDENQFTYKKKHTHKVQRKIFYAFFRPVDNIRKICTQRPASNISCIFRTKTSLTQDIFNM